MKLEVINNKGENTGRQIDLKEEIFNVKQNEHVVYLEVKRYLAAQRQGTHKTKERGEIKGSTKKIKKQKGTGTARMGSIKSGLLRGGATIFGPRPRDYSFKLNKKVKKIAKKSVYSYKFKENKIKILEPQKFESPKTKDFSSLLKNLSLEIDKALFILGEANKNFYLSSRNIPNAKVVTTQEATTYDLLHADYLVLFENAIEHIEKGLIK